MKTSTYFASIAVTIFLTACADGRYEPQLVDSNFGQSARHMVQNSIANPEAAAHPPVNSPRKMDGYAGVNTIDTYRQGFSQGLQQSPSMTINIGTAGGSSGR